MKSFKDYFYLKEEVIKDINHIFKSNIVQNIDISVQQLTKLTNWKHIIVKGYFTCAYNNLTSLDGAPKEVGKSFYCHYNNLTSLEGAPEKVGGDFSCSDNNNLTKLEGALKLIGRDFYCLNCPNIQEDQWQYLPIIEGTLVTDKNLNRNELLILQQLKAQGRIGELDLRGKIEQYEDDDPFNLI